MYVVSLGLKLTSGCGYAILMSFVQKGFGVDSKLDDLQAFFDKYGKVCLYLRVLSGALLLVLV